MGRELVESDVHAIAFVGSQDTGRAIMSACSKGLKRLVLEPGATVRTKDGAKSQESASRIQAGMIGANGGIGGVADSPWVGARKSGFGFASSVEGTRQCAQVRTITRTLAG